MSEKLEWWNSLSQNMQEQLVKEAKLDKISDFLEEDISKIWNLEFLYVNLTQFNDSKALQKLQKLKYLSLYGAEIEGTLDLVFLQDLNSLESLILQEIQPNNLSVITSLPNLKRLDLEDAEHIKEYNFLRKCYSLEELNLDACNIENTEVLSDLYNLRVLKLSCCPIKSIASLGSLTNLRELDVSFTELKDVKVIRHFTNLKKLNVQETDIITIINYLPTELEELIIYNCQNLNPEEVKAIRQLPIKLKTLQDPYKAIGLEKFYLLYLSVLPTLAFVGVVQFVALNESWNAMFDGMMFYFLGGLVGVAVYSVVTEILQLPENPITKWIMVLDVPLQLFLLKIFGSNIGVWEFFTLDFFIEASGLIFTLAFVGLFPKFNGFTLISEQNLSKKGLTLLVFMVFVFLTIYFPYGLVSVNLFLEQSIINKLPILTAMISTIFLYLKYMRRGQGRNNISFVLITVILWIASLFGGINFMEWFKL